MKNSNRPVKCQCCRSEEAVYHYQELEQGRPAFTLLGSFYRGFPTIAKVCGSCADKIRAGVIDLSKS